MGTYIDNARLRAKLVALQGAIERPYILNGFNIDISDYAERIDLFHTSDGSRPTGSTGRRLLLVLKDSCDFCVKALPGWKRLISNAQLGPNDELELISLGGGRLASELSQVARSKDLSVRAYEVSDPVLFSLRSGISAVPMTILLDEDSMVDLVCSGELGDRELLIFENQINDFEKARGKLERGRSPFVTSTAATGVNAIRRLPSVN